MQGNVFFHEESAEASYFEVTVEIEELLASFLQFLRKTKKNVFWPLYDITMGPKNFKKYFMVYLYGIPVLNLQNYTCIQVKRDHL